MYGKFFASTFEGSMYGAGAHVFAVWGYCIASKDAAGTIELNAKKLAGTIGMTVDEAKAAIDYLCAPDPESRNPAHDGARIVHEGGFMYSVVNADLYRDMKSNNDRREYNRLAKQRQRERQRQTKSSGLSNVNGMTARRGAKLSAAVSDVSSQTASQHMKMEIQIQNHASPDSMQQQLGSCGNRGEGDVTLRVTPEADERRSSGSDCVAESHSEENTLEANHETAESHQTSGNGPVSPSEDMVTTPDPTEVSENAGRAVSVRHAPESDEVITPEIIDPFDVGPRKAEVIESLNQACRELGSRRGVSRVEILSEFSRTPRGHVITNPAAASISWLLTTLSLVQDALDGKPRKLSRSEQQRNTFAAAKAMLEQDL